MRIWIRLLILDLDLYLDLATRMNMDPDLQPSAGGSEHLYNGTVPGSCIEVLHVGYGIGCDLKVL
jgi:hypothetical protein